MKLTVERLLTMDAGPALDAHVQQLIFGTGIDVETSTYNKDGQRLKIPAFSTNDDDALALFQRVSQQKMFTPPAGLWAQDPAVVLEHNGDFYDGGKGTFALSMCRAILKLKAGIPETK